MFGIKKNFTAPSLQVQAPVKQPEEKAIVGFQHEAEADQKIKANMLTSIAKLTKTLILKK